MALSDGEKLILLMLSDIYEKLGIEDSVNPAFVKQAIFEEHEWALRWKYRGIPWTEKETPPEVAEVGDILEMWEKIEDSFAALPEPEKDVVLKKAYPFKPNFHGFDGNNETEHKSIAELLINDLDRWHAFKGRDLNSHCPSLDVYGRMLDKFKPIRSSARERNLSAEEIVAILTEQAFGK